MYSLPYQSHSWYTGRSRAPGRKAARVKCTYLVFVELVVDEFVLALLLEGDDDESDEDVDEEERKDDEVDDVEDCHVHAEARLRAAVFVCRVDRVLKNPANSNLNLNLNRNLDVANRFPNWGKLPKLAVAPTPRGTGGTCPKLLQMAGHWRGQSEDSTVQTKVSLAGA